MKNLLKNRRGFTLAEILLVVAIVVVLSGATIIGVASWVNQSQATANQLTAKSADFEKDAVKDVNEKKGTLKDNPIETESLPTGQQNGGNGNSGDNQTVTVIQMKLLSLETSLIIFQIFPEQQLKVIHLTFQQV